MPLAADVVAFIARRLAEHAGLELPSWVIDARATARIAAVGCSPADYVALIDSARGAGELTALIEAVRVGESRLFRHRAQIDVLTNAFVPAMRMRASRMVRVWSAGCAAGEEPYTLAIVLSRALPDHTIRIHASDVSGDAIARARAASYPRVALDHVPAAYHDCFVRDGDIVRVAPAIAARVEFQRANLIDGALPGQYQLVWCRNVLIYFTSDARRAAIETLVRATERDGFLFVGYSESLRDVDGLEARSAEDTVYYVRTGQSASQRPRSEAGWTEHAARMDRYRPTPSGPLPASRADRRSGPTPASADRTPPPAPADRPPPLRSADRTPPPAPADRSPPLRSADRSPPPVSADRSPPPVSADRTPPPRDLSTSSVLALRGQPTAAELTAEISARLALPGLQSLTIDLDGAELLDEDLVRVLRRARAAAFAASVVLRVEATRPGALRWLNRHGFSDGETSINLVAPPHRSGSNDPAGGS